MRFYAVLGIFLLAPFWSACRQSGLVSAGSPSVSGEKAMEYLKGQLDFGPRPPGSAALQQCREYIVQRLRGFGYQVEDDAFVAATPYGAITMHNLIARQGTGSQNVIALASHYDTKRMDDIRFVGANDGGSSTALLIELARVLAGRKDALDYWFVFLDGEEAFVQWSTFDGTYGSRHLASRWKRDGTASRVKALILLDMIGDKNLDIFQEANSTPWLMQLVRETAQKLNLQDIFAGLPAAIEDDHIPFIDAGIPSVNLIDLNYGPNNSHWHTEADTLDKVSAESMEKVGKVVLALLPVLQQKFAGR